MNRDLGVWTYEDCALVLIDYQRTPVANGASHCDRTAVACGAVPNTALAVLTELFRDWPSPMAKKANDVIDWYFAEVPKLTAEVGV